MSPETQKQTIKLPSDQDISGRTFGAEEIAAITDVLQTGVLITTKGKYGKMLEESFAKRLGVKYAYACNSAVRQRFTLQLRRSIQIRATKSSRLRLPIWAR